MVSFLEFLSSPNQLLDFFVFSRSIFYALYLCVAHEEQTKVSACVTDCTKKKVCKDDSKMHTLKLQLLLLSPSRVCSDAIILYGSMTFSGLSGNDDYCCLKTGPFFIGLSGNDDICCFKIIQKQDFFRPGRRRGFRTYG